MKLNTNGIYTTYRTCAVEGNESRQATWRTTGRAIGIMFIATDTDAEACRYYNPESQTPMPGSPPGFISFNFAEYPSLNTVRAWLPQHSDIWDAVEKEYRESLVPPAAKPSGCSEGRSWLSA